MHTGGLDRSGPAPSVPHSASAYGSQGARRSSGFDEANMQTTNMWAAEGSRAFAGARGASCVQRGPLTRVNDGGNDKMEENRSMTVGDAIEGAVTTTQTSRLGPPDRDRGGETRGNSPRCLNE